MMAHGGAAAAAAIANAIKASGAIVRVEPEVFAQLLRKTDQPLIVYSPPRLLSRKHQYLTNYRGLAFFTKSAKQIDVPGNSEVIVANHFWMPG